MERIQVAAAAAAQVRQRRTTGAAQQQQEQAMVRIMEISNPAVMFLKVQEYMQANLVTGTTATTTTTTSLVGGDDPPVPPTVAPYNIILHALKQGKGYGLFLIQQQQDNNNNNNTHYEEEYDHHADHNNDGMIHSNQSSSSYHYPPQSQQQQRRRGGDDYDDNPLVQACWLGEDIFQQILNNHHNNNNNHKVSLSPSSFVSSNYSSHSPQSYHPLPDELTVRNMIELWAQSGLPEAPQHAEAHFTQLQMWYNQQQQQEQQLLEKQQQEDQTNTTTFTNSQSQQQHYLVPWKPTVHHYCAVMEAYSQSHGNSSSNQFLIWQSLERIQALYQEMKKQQQEQDEELYNKNNDINYKNNHDMVISTTRICHALANCRHPHAANIARTVLDDLIQSIVLQLQQDWRNNNNNNNINKPPIELQHVYSAVLTAYGRVGRAQEAQDLFTSMEQFKEELLVLLDSNNTNHNFVIVPDVICYNALIWAHVKVGNSQQVEQIVSHMIQQEMSFMKNNQNKNNRNNHTAATLLDYNTWNGVLASWAESSDPQTASKHIAMILKRLETLAEREWQQEQQEEQPTTTTMEDSMSIQQQPQEQQKQQQRRTFLPISAYNTLMSCYARYNNMEGAQLAYNLFQWICQQQKQNQQKQNKNKNQNLQPNGETYLGLIFAYKNAGNAIQCEYYLRELCHLVRIQQEQQEQRIVPTSSSSLEMLTLDPLHFNVAMEAWAKNTTTTTTRTWSSRQQEQEYSQKWNNAQKVQEIFDLMYHVQIQPNLVNYNTLLWAWARCVPNHHHEHQQDMDSKKNEQEKELIVERIYRQMVEQNDPYLQPDEFTYNAVLYGLLQQQEHQEQKSSRNKNNKNNKKKNLKSRSSSRNNTFVRAERFFANVPIERRNIEMYNTFMTACSRRNEPERVESLFQELVQTMKTTTTTREQHHEQQQHQQLHHQQHIVLDESNPMAEQRQQVSSQPQPPPPRPPFSLYVTRLQAWSKAGNPEKAVTVLREMIVGYQEGSLKEPPTTKGFNAIIHAWLRSNRPNAASMAEAGLIHMMEHGFQKQNPKQKKQEINNNPNNDKNNWDHNIPPPPNALTFTMVISAYAKSGLPNAGDKAWSLLQKLKQLAAQAKEDGEEEEEAIGRNGSLQIPSYNNNNTNKNNNNNESTTSSGIASSPWQSGLQPTFVTYTEVILALLRSTTIRIDRNNNNNHHHHVDHKVRNLERVRQLFMELQTKPKSFWFETRTEELTIKIEQALQKANVAAAVAAAGHAQDQQQQQPPPPPFDGGYQQQQQLVDNLRAEWTQLRSRLVNTTTTMGGANRIR